LERPVFPGKVVKALIAFALVVGIHARPAAAGECTNAQLRATLRSAPTDPHRAPQLQKLLVCLGKRVDTLPAAAAAYELALHFAGANQDVPADYRLAAEWARKSLAYVQSTNNLQLSIETEPALLQLNYQAAADTSELRQAADALVSFAKVRCPLSKKQDTCAEAYHLLGKAERDLTDRGDRDARTRAIAALQSFLKSELGKRRNTERASALLDLGTLRAMVPEGHLAHEDAEATASALREAGAIFHEACELGRERLAQVNLGALLGNHMSVSSSSLGEAETALRPLASPDDPSIDPAVRETAMRNLGSVLFQKQTGNRTKNLEEAIDYLRAAHAAVPRSAPDLWAKTADNLAIALEASALRNVERLKEARTLLADALQLVEMHGIPAAGFGPLTTLISIKLHLLRLGEDEDVEAIGGLLERAKALTGQDRSGQAQIAALEADYHSS
jgi:tetratricopeptide (TPR) repeat protein